MAVEYDFDPEDDLKKSGDRSPDFRYQAKAVVFACVNRGEITGKKDYTGGIAGRMDLGRISSCEGYGTVTGTNGNYVGGIAGASWGRHSRTVGRRAVYLEMITLAELPDLALLSETVIR